MVVGLLSVRYWHRMYVWVRSNLALMLFDQIEEFVAGAFVLEEDAAEG